MAHPPRLSSPPQHTRNSRFQLPKITFTPQARGHNETLLWVNTGTSESIGALLMARDRAVKELRRGLRTKGTKEIQKILSEPSLESVEQLHDVQIRNQVALRYGTPGVVAYNFSRSLGWNRASASQPSPPQLIDIGTRPPKVGDTPKDTQIAPSFPIDWIVLPDSTATQQTTPQRQPQPHYCPNDKLEEDAGRSLSVVSEPGGWRDIEQMDVADFRLDFTRDMELELAGEQFCQSGDDEYDPYDVNTTTGTPFEGQATLVTLTQTSGMIRQIRI
ncbi:hypothetical protein SAMD00023353_0302280 [Rosellinia necatrix]|uniref:Uncharacterized protein n=1 Tax=Rosellinia necatrix TaxID=77044 RepID=A0A1W2TDN1_ROSNE|nr:hypothetical protein SAMD00023353_0302280 [Rosellinia necatrix]